MSLQEILQHRLLDTHQSFNTRINHAADLDANGYIYIFNCLDVEWKNSAC